jgi:putative heme iron utilization protein
MPYALDAGGRPIFLISNMAVHKQNLKSDPRASLFITQAGVKKLAFEEAHGQNSELEAD